MRSARTASIRLMRCKLKEWLRYCGESGLAGRSLATAGGPTANNGRAASARRGGEVAAAEQPTTPTSRKDRHRTAALPARNDRRLFLPAACAQPQFGL